MGLVVRVDYKEGDSQDNDQDHLHKEKRKRNNSIMQIEKLNDKIVKGWNQIINDLKPHNDVVTHSNGCRKDEGINHTNYIAHKDKAALNTNEQIQLMPVDSCYRPILKQPRFRVKFSSTEYRE